VVEGECLQFAAYRTVLVGDDFGVDGVMTVIIIVLLVGIVILLLLGLLNQAILYKRQDEIQEMLIYLVAEKMREDDEPQT
jgi:hypothetical protein